MRNYTILQSPKVYQLLISPWCLSSLLTREKGLVGGVHMMKMYASCPRPPLGPRGRHTRLGGGGGAGVLHLLKPLFYLG
jgi:hypothetical protein